MTLLRLSGLLPVLALAACVPTTARQPQTQTQTVAPPVQVLPPRPAQQLPAPTPSVDWIDAALSAGDWTYRQGGSAAFGPPASPSFVIACTGARIRLERTGAASGSQLTIRTSSEARTLAATPTAGGLVAELAASDQLLDAIAFSRGRFSVEAPGMARLVIPAWPEAARVVEECR
ncbi:hypothetical protein [Sphingosinicella sp. YJ22]|uniref:hypothetical protein n=1 Tax=Sphingosinicella sp. YJ22 TaxID=1104780 RepID=UPI00140CB134|nr:hypothetical protein [Sphingosinicella sp. YJ22]